MQYYFPIMKILFLDSIHTKVNSALRFTYFNSFFSPLQLMINKVFDNRKVNSGKINEFPPQFIFSAKKYRLKMLFERYTSLYKIKKYWQVLIWDFLQVSCSQNKIHDFILIVSRFNKSSNVLVIDINMKKTLKTRKIQRWSEKRKLKIF